MKKTARILSVLILSGFVFSACAADVDYTYKWEAPVFSTHNLVTKEFEDFSITYPSGWSVYFEDYREDDQIFYKMRVPSERGSASGVNIRYVAERHALTDFNEASFVLVAEELSENLGVSISHDRFSYGKLYGTGMAFSRMGGNYGGKSMEWILQYVPTRSGLYVFTYKIVDGQGRNDIIAVMNSVNFR